MAVELLNIAVHYGQSDDGTEDCRRRDGDRHKCHFPEMTKTLLANYFVKTRTVIKAFC